MSKYRFFWEDVHCDVYSTELTNLGARVNKSKKSGNLVTAMANGHSSDFSNKLRNIGFPLMSGI